MGKCKLLGPLKYWYSFFVLSCNVFYDNIFIRDFYSINDLGTMIQNIIFTFIALGK